MNTTYPTPWGHHYTYNELTELLAQPIRTIIEYDLVPRGVPMHMIDDIEQCSYLYMWERLRNNPNTLNAFAWAKTPIRLAKAITERAYQMPTGFTKRTRVAQTYSQLNPRIHTTQPWNTYSPKEHCIEARSDALWTRKQSRAHRRDVLTGLLADGYHTDWRDVADLRCDLEAVIQAILQDLPPTAHTRFMVGLQCLLTGLTPQEAATTHGVTRSTAQRWMQQARTLLANHFASYLE